MLVDDKLAKEKLACELEAQADKCRLYSWDRETPLNLAQSIRHTDLTDCQPPTAVHDRGCALFTDAVNPCDCRLADQGSVRNATDMRERCAKVIEDHIQMLIDDKEHPCGADFWVTEIANLEDVLIAIRALPDQKD